MAQSKLMRYVDESTKKSLAPIDYAPGSKPIRKRQYEVYCQHRAKCLSKVDAYRRAMAVFRCGRVIAIGENDAYQSAWKLERKREIIERIQYLARVETDRIPEIRALIAERLLSIHEADIGDAFELDKENGKEKPKLLAEMSPDFRKSIKKVVPDSKGNYIPELYDKTAVSKELRAMFAIGKPSDASEASRLSDAELVSQLADQAKELGVDIKLDYTFAQPKELEPGEPAPGVANALPSDDEEAK